MNTINKVVGRYWRWHPKIALRYLPIVAEIRRIDGQGSVLEVGSGSLGIAPYLGREVTGVDLHFTDPKFPLLKTIKAQATKLPFADNSFDFVVNVDLLEHIAPDKRQVVVSECLRVGKRGIFIAVPTGKEAEKQDQDLDQKYIALYGRSFPFLTEHLRFGLPAKAEIMTMIDVSSKKLGKKITVRISDNLNLLVRRFLMWGWMTNNVTIDILFRKVFLLFIPILRVCNWQPTYRSIFFISIENLS